MLQKHNSIYAGFIFIKLLLGLSEIWHPQFLVKSSFESTDLLYMSDTTVIVEGIPINEVTQSYWHVPETKPLRF